MLLRPPYAIGSTELAYHGTGLLVLTRGTGGVWWYRSGGWTWYDSSGRRCEVRYQPTLALREARY
eukprot:129264-Rhodomonas_salina.1